MWLWTTPAALATAITVALTVYVLRRPPPPPLWPTVPVLIGGAALFSIGELYSVLARTLPQAWEGAFLLYSGVLISAPALWTLGLRFAEANQLEFSFGRSRWASLPWWVSGALAIALYTAPLHGLFLTPRVGERNSFHVLWYVLSLESWGVVLGAVSLFLVTAARARSRLVRGQSLLLAAGCLAPLPLNTLYLSLPYSLPADPTSLGLAASGLLFVAGIYRQQLFALPPIGMWELLRQDSDAVLVLDLDRRLQFANQAAHTLFRGVPLALGEEPLSRLARDLRLDGRTVTADDLLERDDVAGRTYHLEGDADRWLRIEPTTLRSARGGPAGHCVRIRDETAQRRAAEDLSHARQLESLGVVAGGVAHDFNNLLAVVQGNAALARRRPAGAQNDRFLADIEKASRRASELTEQLLTYAGKTSARILPLNVSELLIDLQQRLLVLTPKEAQLEFDLDDGLPIARGDAGQLRQVVTDLVQNAGESLQGREGTVRLSTGTLPLPNEAHRKMPVPPPQSGLHVFIRVEDNGCGIDGADLERIFEPFYTTKFTGRGLGLAATAGVVRMHDGGLSVRSSPGSGSVFTLFLPVEDSAQPGD